MAWMLVVVGVSALLAGGLWCAVVLPARREEARARESWQRWAAEHGWHHAAPDPALVRPSTVRSLTPAQRRGLIVRDLTRAVDDHVVRAVEHRRWVVVGGGEYDRLELEDTALVEIDELPVDAPTVVLRPRGWPQTRWERQIGTLPEVDPGPLAATFTAAARDTASARALLAPMERLTTLPKPPGTVVVYGRHVVMVWDGPLTTATLETAIAFLRAFVAALPRDLSRARDARRRADPLGRSGIERFLADTLDRVRGKSPGRSSERMGRELAQGDPWIGSRRPGA